MKTITLSEEQAKLILQTIDVAIKVGGTQTAAVVLPLVYEIEKQLQNDNVLVTQNTSE
jgi:hypothetical protein